MKVRISSLGGFLLPRERCFCRLKVFRRIATCYDKLARNFLAAVHLAAIVVYVATLQRRRRIRSGRCRASPTAAQQAEGAKPGMMWRTQRWRGASVRGSDPVSGDEPQTESDLNF
jgi:hypothetical protein